MDLQTRGFFILLVAVLILVRNFDRTVQLVVGAVMLLIALVLVFMRVSVGV